MQPPIQKKIKKVVFFGTGGTISGLSEHKDDSLNYKVGEVGISELVKGAGAIKGYGILEDEPNREQTQQASEGASNCTYDFIFEQICQVDSKDMQLPIWVKLIERIDFWAKDPDLQGILITHGTDTLEETAFFLSAMLPKIDPLPAPTVVLTCAMRPASDPHADGPQNIKDSLSLLLDEQWAHKGVLVVCAGEVHSGAHVQKIYTDRVNAFSSLPGETLASIKDGRVLPNSNLTGLFKINWEQWSQPTLFQLSQQLLWPWVEIVQNFVHSGEDAVKALLSYQPETGNKISGIVLAGTGMGSASENLVHSLKLAQSAGVTVWQSSKCAFAVLKVRDDLSFYDFHGLSPTKARIALTLHLIAKK